MATWITHLRIAETLLHRIPDLETGSFAVGNIAPDSGIPDEKWENFTPDPKITHFLDNADPHSSNDLVFYRKYLLPFKEHQADSVFFSFRWGYFFHLVTDNLWGEMIGRPAQERYKSQFAADPRFIWEIKEDWYGQDFIYVRAHPASLFWSVFLKCEPVDAGLDFLPLEALKQRIDYIQSFYQRRDDAIMQQISRPMIYLSKDEMDHFVILAVDKLYWVYDQLRSGTFDSGPALSILDWEGSKFIQPACHN